MTTPSGSNRVWALLSQASPSHAAIVGLVVALAALILAATMFLLVVRSRRTREGFDAFARRHGLRYAANLAVGHGLLPQIHGRGTQRYQHVMTGVVDGREVAIGQHYYLVHTGNAMIPVKHAVAAAGIGERWPQVRIAPSTLLSRAIDSVGLSARIDLEHAGFNGTFRLTSEDETFAVMLLSDEAQEYLTRQAPEYEWRIGGGRVAALRSGGLTPERAEELLETVRGFLALIPEVLGAYGEEGRGDA